MREIYLDNAATTRPTDAVIDKMMCTYREDYGNPSSLHRKGMKAEEYIREATQILSDIMRVDKSTIYYTSGGSESNNTAIFGVASAYVRSGKHIITTRMEHPATGKTIKKLEESGYEITYIDVDEKGYVNLEQLKDSIREDTILVTMIYVNNEIGTIQPIEEIGNIIKQKNKQTLFHVDAIQGFGKFSIQPTKCHVDLLSISAHKFHGPKGVGVLYVNRGVKLNPLIYGGGQQKGYRSGTENVPGVAGLGQAAKEAYDFIKSNPEYISELKKRFVDGIADIKDIKINGPSVEEGSPYVLSLLIKDVRGEVLLHSLEDDGIYLSTGSACSSNKPEELSPTLNSLGYNKQMIDSVVRISFSRYNTLDDIDNAVEAFKKMIPRLRMFTLGGRKR